MAKLEKMVGALKTSLIETHKAGRPDAEEALAKSVDQFAADVAELQKAAVADMRPLPAPGEHDAPAYLGHMVLGLADAVRAVEGGQCVMLKGGTPPSEGAMELLKASVDLAHEAVRLMAAEQATPVAGEEEIEEGLGMAKLATAQGEVLVKHSLSEDAMALLADPEEATASAIEAAVYALDVLGVDTRRLLKFAPGEEGEEDEGDEAEGDEDEGDEAEGDEDEGDEAEGDEDEGDEAEGEGGDHPLMSLTQLGLATMATAAALREAAEAAGAEPADLARIDTFAKHGAAIAVEADRYMTEQEGAPEGEEMAPEDQEAEMALAARITELAKEARDYVLKTTPREELEKALGTGDLKKEAPKAPAPPKAEPTPAPKTPELAKGAPKLIAVDKATDGAGQGEVKSLEERAQELAKMSPADRFAAMYKEAAKKPVAI